MSKAKMRKVKCQAYDNVTLRLTRLQEAHPKRRSQTISVHLPIQAGNVGLGNAGKLEQAV